MIKYNTKSENIFMLLRDVMRCYNFSDEHKRDHPQGFTIDSERLEAWSKSSITVTLAPEVLSIWSDKE